MTTSGFYKSDLTYAPNWVIAPGLELLRSAKDSYTYPVEGWYWFESMQDAATYFGVEPPNNFNQGTIFVPEGTVVPNWDGLYQSLMVSAVYQHLVGLSLTFVPVNSALDKVIASIQYGSANPLSAVAMGAFQSATSLLLYALGLVNQPLSTEHLAEIRTALDNNGFESINLG